MSGKTNPSTLKQTQGQQQTPPAQTPDPGTPTGQNTEQQGDAQDQRQQQPDQQQQQPAVTPAPLHEHPDFKPRMEQAQRAGQRALLTALGFEAETPEDIERAQQEVASLLDFARQQREATLSVEERLNEQITTLTGERDRLRQERDRLKDEADNAQQALAEFKADLARGSAVESAAEAAGAARPADVLLWLRANRSAELAQVVGEDGGIDEALLTALVDACRDARPEWFVARIPGNPSHDGARAPQAPSNEKEMKELARQAVRRGMR